MREVLWLLALGACAEVTVDDDVLDPGEDPLCAGNVWFPDRDLDGAGDDQRRVQRCERPDASWITVGGDCADDDATRRPGASEIADGLDGDCDGTIDEGTPWGDDDGDGYCADLVRCGELSVLPGDCADNDGLRFPGATERCNGLDDDCDLVVPAPEGDGDGDGALACVDCDDDAELVFPGAVEACDGVDSDCDGLTDNLDADGDGWTGCATGGGPIDVLLLIDRDPASAVLRERVATAARAWPALLDDADKDWKIVVSPADAAAVQGTVTRADLDADDRLYDLIHTASVTGTPATSSNTLEALQQGTWRRSGAALVVWIVTLREDRSDVDVGALAAGLRPPSQRDIVRVAVLAPGSGGCDGGDVVGEPAPRLEQLGRAGGGLRLSACAPAWPLLATSTWWPTAVPRDCDDAHAAAFPGAAESCDAVDNDCDGRTDEDDDEDGFTVCEGDCDDDDAGVYDGATERCNGRDDDCDGLIPTREVDSDGDGLSACAGDCDDGRAAVYPGAVEVCGDGLDADCSGDDGEGADAVDHDGDGVSACGGDCDDDDDAAFPDAPEHPFDGRDNDCDGLVDGLDPDKVVALALPSAGNIVYRSSRALYRMCGDAWQAITVNGDGFLVPGTATFIDASPTTEELRDYAPFVAAGWEDLDAGSWSGGRFLSNVDGGSPAWIVVRADSISVIYDHVPYRKNGGHLTSLTRLGLDDLATVRVLEGKTTDETTVGLACGDRNWNRVDFGVTPDACVQPGTDDAASGALASGPPPVSLGNDCP